MIPPDVPKRPSNSHQTSIEAVKILIDRALGIMKENSSITEEDFRFCRSYLEYNSVMLSLWEEEKNKGRGTQ